MSDELEKDNLKPITHYATRNPQTASRSVKVVALYSGGLDSTLAILTVLKQGIEVRAVTFLNHFGCGIEEKSSCSKDPFSAAEKFGFDVRLSHLSGKFIEIVKHPKFGHGRNMNPCMDCRILMLKEIKEYMNMTGAEFVITGEVLGQRPMSQRRDALDIIDRESGLKGHVLRPLSAKLLKPTVAEERGLINRELLYAFSGRSRKPQMSLAKEFGLTDYPAPAGGCLLTEPNYSHRLKELLGHDQDPCVEDLSLLKLGRHFRLSSRCKVIVGRDEAENRSLLSMSGNKWPYMTAENCGSPVTVIRGEADEEIIHTAASICARYSDARDLNVAEVSVYNGNDKYQLTVSPAKEEIIQNFKIELKKTIINRVCL
jgi:tRNA-uridine 2-sulfurtransferase